MGLSQAPVESRTQSWIMDRLRGTLSMQHGGVEGAGRSYARMHMDELLVSLPGGQAVKSLGCLSLTLAA